MCQCIFSHSVLPSRCTSIAADAEKLQIMPTKTGCELFSKYLQFSGFSMRATDRLDRLDALTRKNRDSIVESMHKNTI